MPTWIAKDWYEITYQSISPFNFNVKRKGGISMLKKMFFSGAILLFFVVIHARTIEKTYVFDNYEIRNHGEYQTVLFENTQLIGTLGEPVLPYHSVTLMLPPGEMATSIEVTGCEEVVLPQKLSIFPHQAYQPISKGRSSSFFKNENVYRSENCYPGTLEGKLQTGYLCGYSVALSSFTPVRYIPRTGELSFYRKVTVRITTQQDSRAQRSLELLNSSNEVIKRVKDLVQNDEMLSSYPVVQRQKDDYDMLIVTADAFKDKFDEIIAVHNKQGLTSKLVTISDIGFMRGRDTQEKIRNYIIKEFKENKIQYVLLGGDVQHVPYRGFYGYVKSSQIYQDKNIPADLYYSGLDGTWNDNNDDKWGEPGEDDLLADVAVGRVSFNTESELAIISNKIVSYQEKPITSELKQPLLAGEDLYDNPKTWGKQYIELLVGHHEENGYTTDGIPEDQNTIMRLYDKDGVWSKSTLINKINQGPSFIHHCGHANTNTVMKLSMYDITNNNFSKVDGIQHNFTMVFTHGCICGAFDKNCILEKMVTIKNFAVATVGNSRYGWFNEGQTEGPAIHLHREFVHELYNGTPTLGYALMIAKQKTKPWVDKQGEHEPGATRWNFYDCNVLGDPALEVYVKGITTPVSKTSSLQNLAQNKLDILAVKRADNTVFTFNIVKNAAVTVAIYNIRGQKIVSLINDKMSAGNHTIVWNGKGESQKPIVSGRYFVKLTAADHSIVKSFAVTQ